MSALSFILILVLFVIQQQNDSVDIFVVITNVILTYQYNSNIFLSDEQHKDIFRPKIG
jgi:hypothetical protein